MMQRRKLLKTTVMAAAGMNLGALIQSSPAWAAVKPAKAMDFKHPGLLHSDTELTALKAQIKAGDRRTIKHWKALEDWCEQLLDFKPKPRKKVVRGPSNNPDIGGTDLSREASATYSLALAWCLSGKKVYADKAIEHFNAWSGTLEELDGHDTKLLSGMMGVKFINAAELIRHTYDGWKPADQNRFEAMLRGVFYEPIKDFYPTANGNWDASMIQTMLAMGIFLEDQKMFDRAADYYRQGEGNGAITKYFNEFGQCQESGRDQAHTQMGLAFLCVACEMAWKQGVDLYSEADNRLALGFEYTAKYNLGHEVPYEPYKSVEGRYHYKRISDKARGRFAPIFELPVYHYHHRMGMAMPFTREAAGQEVEQRSINRGWAYMRWSDLTFHRPPKDA